MESIIDLALVTLLAVIALGILRLRNLFAVVMMMGIYSLVSASFFVVLDAQDVAFTEAAVGAGVSTILALGTLSIVGRHRKDTPTIQLLPLLAVLVTGGALVYGSLGLPPWGDAANPIHHHVVPRYIDSRAEMDVDNTVSSILASYRGYDTMGETTVVFTAMVGVFALIVAGGTTGRGTSGSSGSEVTGERLPKRSGRKEKR
jgi:multicomponent Na+:H+ antiporter subunit B